MKNLSALILALIAFFFLAYPSDASPRVEIEKALLTRDWLTLDVLLRDIPESTGQQRYDKQELIYIIKPLRAFLTKSDACSDTIKENVVRLECYRHLFAFEWPAVHKKLPFSQEFVDALNQQRVSDKGKWKLLTDEQKEKRDAYRAEQEKQLAEQRARIAAENERLAVLQNQREEESRWEVRAKSAFSDAQELAFESKEYKSLESRCSICALIADRANSERRIAEEKRYSARYGAINLSKIDGYKQRIISCDNQIPELKKEYRKVTGSAFVPADCKKVSLPCEDALDELRFKLMDGYLEQENDIVKKIIWKDYFYSRQRQE